MKLKLNSMYLHGSHTDTFTNKRTTHVQSKTIQVDFNQLNCPHIYAPRFGLYLGHLQVCQYKEDKQGDNENVIAVFDPTNVDFF